MENKVTKLISWHVNGLGTYTKRHKVFNYLKQKKPDIIMLQETHLSEKDVFRIKERWIGQMVHNTYNQKQRGVCILFSKQFKVQILKEYKDKDGRILIILIHIGTTNQNIILSNIYAPNEEDPLFFYKVKTALLEFGDFPIIWGGDFNQVLDTFLDKSNNTNLKISKTQEEIQNIGKELGLKDIWRLLNPTTRDYTFFSNRHSVFSRIDYFLLSHLWIRNVTDCKIGTIGITDHAAIEISLFTNVKKDKDIRWRMNVSLLDNIEFTEHLKNQINIYFETNRETAEQKYIWDGFKAFVRGIYIQQASKIKKSRTVQS